MAKNEKSDKGRKKIVKENLEEDQNYKENPEEDQTPVGEARRNFYSGA